jgi:hypothetical protein
MDTCLLLGKGAFPCLGRVQIVLPWEAVRWKSRVRLQEDIQQGIELFLEISKVTMNRYDLLELNSSALFP